MVDESKESRTAVASFLIKPAGIKRRLSAAWHFVPFKISRALSNIAFLYRAFLEGTAAER
jgi:hypothetical protein